MPKREIKKTVITYKQQKPKIDEPQRSRQKKQAKVQVVDQNSRKARLAALKKRQQQNQTQIDPQPTANVHIQIQQNVQAPKQQKPGEDKKDEEKKEKQIIPAEINKQMDNQMEQEENDELDDDQKQRVMMKPVFITKEDRQIEEKGDLGIKQQQRKKKALKYTTKMLLIENAKAEAVEDQEIVNSSDDDIRTDLPNDDDQKNQEFQYEQWKIRELKRIRRDREERRRAAIEKAEIERRRKMNNQEILLQNKVMGSDATDNNTETKYVFMQKYYHKGAFYQDSEDAIFKRDYNLPTPLEMQDKSMLPQILQRRKGNFGAKGQSKYKHLTAEDTTNFDPQYRADQSILSNWKKKTAGYKGSGASNI